MYRDDALTHGWPGASRGYLVTSEGAISTADPRSVAGLADGALNPWSKPYCSSVEVASAGEHTQRRVVSMHDDGCGWTLVSTTAAGSVPGTRGARIARPALGERVVAVHPGSAGPAEVRL